MKRTILVGSDGAPGVEGALRLAAALEAERGWAVEVVATLEPVPRYGPVGVSFPEGYALFDRVQAEALQHAVERHVRETVAGASWPVRVELGAVAAGIARRAVEVGAGLVLVGTSQRPLVDRWMSGETALKLGRLVGVPVLAVPTEVRAVPRRAVVAVDFSDFSLRAAHAVLEVMDEVPQIFLVHVMWPPAELGPFPSLEEWRRTYREGAEARLRELAGELSRARLCRAEPVVTAGEPSVELLSLAGRLRADLLAAGSHGYGFFGRLVLGSVSTQLLRAARVPVLIAPPPAPAEELAAVSVSSRASPPAR